MYNCTSYNHEEMSLTLISSNIKEIETPSWWTGSCFCGIDRWMGRCGQLLQLKLLTDQDTWDACVGAGIFYFDSSPSLVWPFFAPICRLFIGFFLPLLAFPGHHGQARPLLSDCGSRPSQWFHQPILHIHHSLLFHRRWRQRQGAKNDADRDVGYKRHLSKEQLKDWKTPVEIVKDNMWGACTF